MMLKTGEMLRQPSVYRGSVLLKISRMITITYSYLCRVDYLDNVYTRFDKTKIARKSYNCCHWVRLLRWCTTTYQKKTATNLS